MNIASLFQSAGRLLNDLASQVSTDPAQSQAATTTTQSTGKLSVIPTTATCDHFTPSQQSAVSNTAGDAGLFQVQQARLTPTQSAATAVQQPTTTTQSSATQNATTSAATTASATPAVTSTISGDANSATNTAVTNPDSPQTQQALQSLNSSLASLGLTSAEIAAFDQYASVLLQFDPNALQDLQSQLNLLATQYTTNGGGNAAVQPAATNTASAATAAPTPAAGAASANSAATSASAVPLLNAAQSAAASSTNANPAFQLAAFSITFGAPGPSSSQSSNPNAQSQTTPPIGLTIVEASVTLNNPTGQSVQLQSPSPSTPAAAKTATA
jgi:hypothetical protein